MQSIHDILDRASGLLHRMHEPRYLPTSPTGEYWRVETWRGTYVGTFITRRDAETVAREIVDRYDARVCPVYLTRQ